MASPSRKYLTDWIRLIYFVSQSSRTFGLGWEGFNYTNDWSISITAKSVLSTIRFFFCFKIKERSKRNGKGPKYVESKESWRWFESSRTCKQAINISPSLFRPQDCDTRNRKSKGSFFSPFNCFLNGFFVRVEFVTQATWNWWINKDEKNLLLLAPAHCSLPSCSSE